MNANIKQIDKDIYAVNFSYLEAGYIKELGIMQEKQFASGMNDILRLTYDGKYILNSGIDSMPYLKIIQAVMKLTNKELKNKKGFFRFIQYLDPVFFSGKSDIEIMTALVKDNISQPLINHYRIFAEWEAARRIVMKEYKQKNPAILRALLKRR